MKLIKPTQINEYQETKADRIIETVFIVGLSLILLVLSVLILATTSKAASKDNLPFYSSYIDSSLQNYFVTHPDAINTILAKYPNLTDNFALFVYEADSNSTYQYINVFILTDTSNFVCYDSSGTVIDWSEFKDYKSDYFRKTGNSSCSVWQIRKNNGAFASGSSSNATRSNLSFFGNHVMNNLGVTYCYPIYVKGEVLFNGVPILKEGEPLSDIVPTGHATEPDFDDNNNINTDGHAQQPQDPTFPTFIPPTIDTNNLESLVTSLINFVKEFADFVGECFSTFFSWLVEVIKNAIQSVINTIRESVNFLYENFVSLFENIAESVSYIIQPLDVNEVHSALVATDVYSVPSSFVSFTDDFEDAFDIQEPDTFTITIHVEDIALLNQSAPYVLNLGSQFYPIRSALRTFLWILVTFASVIFVEHNLSSWLKGSGEEK